MISYAKQHEYCSRLLSHLELIDSMERWKAGKEGIEYEGLIASKKLAAIKKDLKTIVDEYETNIVERIAAVRG